MSSIQRPTVDMIAEIALTLMAVSFFIIGVTRRSRQALPLPPGPRKYPIIGNLLNAPKSHAWLRYMQWSKELHSDIIHLQILQSSVIVLNSLEAANELLSRRSALYSSRPVFTMIYELMGQDFNFGFMPYGGDWRDHRRVFWQEFNPANSWNHQPIQLRYARDLLQRLLEDPDNFLSHIRYSLGASIITIAYGFDVQEKNDPHIAIAAKAMHHFSEAAISGSFMVDNLPILKYLPRWMPGAGFLTYADQARRDTEQMIEVPYALSHKLLAEGKGKPSLVSRCVARTGYPAEGGRANKVMENVASVSYEGGAETTLSSLSTFIAAMVLYPDVQVKAQKELDTCLGSRLPAFEDKIDLPYIHAIMLEVLRWQPPFPLGIAHASITEDEYKGYRIPKNATIFANSWAILHDETLFPDSGEFKPERFLKDGRVDPRLSEPVATFGFGRRVCPGRYLAMDSLWISLASILSVYKITGATDQGGHREVEPNIEYTPTFIRHLLPFKCSIKSRSEEAEKKIYESDLI